MGEMVGSVWVADNVDLKIRCQSNSVLRQLATSFHADQTEESSAMRDRVMEVLHERLPREEYEALAAEYDGK